MLWNKHALSIIYVAATLVTEVSAQSNVFTGRNWTWISGSNTLSSAGSYGTLGVESASNSPPARQMHSIVYHTQTNSIYVGHGVTTSTSNFY